MAGEALAQSLLQVAEAIEQGRPEAAILEALRQARTARGANGRTPDAQHLDTVLKTWQEVWPRMGGQRDFRMAVIREARSWAKRLGTSHG